MDPLLALLALAGSVVLFGIYGRLSSSSMSAERAETMRRGGPMFEVESADGVPSLEQFRQTVPRQLARYEFSYSSQRSEQFAFVAIQSPTGAYDVLIRKSPSYSGRAADSVTSHRHGIGTARERICFTGGVEPHDLPDACRKAVLWADLTSRYIATGKTF